MYFKGFSIVPPAFGTAQRIFANRPVLRYETMNAKVILWLLDMVPASWRRVVIGSNGNPSRIANFLHGLLNRVPMTGDEALQCKGDLSGFRMYTEWHRYRGLVYGNWEPEVSTIVRSAVHTGMSALDVGGHIGYYTLLLAKCVGKSGRVYAFEPLPGNFELLQKNIELNHLDQVEAARLAIFSYTGTLTMTVPEGNSNSGGASVVHRVGSNQIQVETTTLDSFCTAKEIRPEFIKIDVEGAEYDVLKGAELIVRGCRPKLLIELHHFDGNLQANRAPSLLEQWGYRLKWIERFEQTSHVFAIHREEVAPN